VCPAGVGSPAGHTGFTKGIVVLVSGERDGQVVAHTGGIYRFPAAGQPAEVPRALAAHLLAAGGFRSHHNSESGGTVHLQKDQGGCEITHKGSQYAWENDGDVTEVPDELAMELVPLGGYRVVQPKAAEDPEDTGDGGTGDGGDGETGGPDEAGDGTEGGDGEDGEDGQGDDATGTTDPDPDPDPAPEGTAKRGRTSRRKTTTT
jgi:hypothetical protein